MMRRRELTPGLEDFGRRLAQAARADVERERQTHRARRQRTRRTLAGAVAAILLPTGALAGAGLLDFNPADPLPEERLPGSLEPASDPAVVPSSAVPDPTAGPPWALKVFTNAAGDECVALGRLQDGQLGTLVDGRFRPFPLRTPGNCGDVARSGLSAFLQRDARARERTFVYGLSAGRSPVYVTIAGERHSIRPGALGTFLLVLPGVLEREGVVVRTRVDGRRIVRRLG